MKGDILNYELLRVIARQRIDELLRDAAYRRCLALARLPRRRARSGAARALGAVVRFAADLRML